MYQPQSMRVPAASFLVLEKKATAESWKHTLLLTSCQMYIDCYHTNQDPPTTHPHTDNPAAQRERRTQITTTSPSLIEKPQMHPEPNQNKGGSKPGGCGWGWREAGIKSRISRQVIL